jgi:hypothetical protein
MTLYQRLKPEYKESISEYSKRYPHSAKSIITSLKSENFFTNIRYGDAMEVESICNLKYFGDAFTDL